MKKFILIPTLLAAAVAWTAQGQTGSSGSSGASGASGSAAAAAASPAAPNAPAGTVQANGQSSQTLQQSGATANGTVNGSGNVTIQGDPNPGGLHKRSEFPNVVVPGELRRDFPPGMVSGGGTNVPAGTNDVTDTNQFGFAPGSNGVPPTTGFFNSNQFNAAATSGTQARPVAMVDTAATRDDQVLLIKLRNSVSTEVQAAATTAAPNGNTITPPVHFNVDNGVVRLFGTVPTEGSKQRILMIMQRIPGVNQVIDQLQVSGGAAATTGAATDVNAQGSVSTPAATAAGAAATSPALAPTSTRPPVILPNSNQLRHGPVFPPPSRSGATNTANP